MMFAAIIAVLAGLLLIADFLKLRSGPGQVVKALMPFQTIIGIVALVVGILNIFSGLLGITLILGGLVLAAHALTAVPRIGDELESAGGFLSKFSTFIGVIVLVIGFINLIQALL